MKELTLEQLSQHDGSDPSKPLYLAIQGVVFNVSRGRQFYGPDGGSPPILFPCWDFPVGCL